MCFNYISSLTTFFIGVIASYLVIEYGNSKYKIENTVFGIFFIFIASIQFMDFLFWIDLKNKLGINYVTTLIGPLLNVGQPLILYIIKILYFRPTLINTNSTYNTNNVSILILNLLYLIYLVKMYILFISTEVLTTSKKHGNLSWPWIKYSNPYFYLIVLAINTFYLTNFTYSLVVFSITFFFFFLSNVLFSYNIGELWCFFGAFIPIWIFMLSYYI